MIIAILAGLALVLLAIRWLANVEPTALAIALKRIIYLALALLSVFLILTGRIALLIPLLIAAIPFIGPALKEYLINTKASSKNQSHMTKDEAYSALNLEPGATKAQIVAAHKKLMKVNHPDTGGSTYISQKLNQAKEILLKDLNDKSK